MSQKHSDISVDDTQAANIDSASIHFELLPIDNNRLANLCGQFNEHLGQIGDYFKVDVACRSNHFEVSGDGRYLKPVKTLIQTLYNVAENEQLSPIMVQLYLNDNIVSGDSRQTTSRDEKRNEQQSGKPGNKIHKNMTDSPNMNDTSSFDAENDNEAYSSVKNRRGKITGRNKSQQDYLQQIKNNDLTIGVGPAGTGKTYLAVASAVEALENDQVDRIILVRPAVEAGERLGFLPGDLAQKIDPYMRPMYDALFEMMGQQKVNKLLEKNVIEIAPLAYMRGRTLNDSFIILDEAQNTTIDQMKMFLTRIGFGSKAVVTGDITQVDLPREKTSGLRHVLKILLDIPGIGVTQFNKGDIVRHPLVKKIVHAYEQDEVR